MSIKVYFNDSCNICRLEINQITLNKNLAINDDL